MLMPEINVIKFNVADVITSSTIVCTNDSCPNDAGEF